MCKINFQTIFISILVVASSKQEEEGFKGQAYEIRRPRIHPSQGPRDGAGVRVLDQVRLLQAQLPLLKTQAEQESGDRGKLKINFYRTK